MTPFKPNKSVPADVASMILRSTQGVRVYNLTFLRVQKTLYLLSQTPSDNPIVIDAEDKVIKTVGSLGRAIQMYSSLIDSTMQLPPVLFETQQYCYTPETSVYANLITQYDELVVHCEAQRASSRMTPMQCNTIVHGLRHELTRATKGFERLLQKTLDAISRAVK